MKTSTEQQIVQLFVQAMRTALALVDDTEKPAAKATPGKKKTPGKTGASGFKGICTHRSKYNPWRAYVWDKALQSTIYLGAFPSINKARAAQKAYSNGQPVTTGTKAAKATFKAPLKIVKAA